MPCSSQSSLGLEITSQAGSPFSLLTSAVTQIIPDLPSFVLAAFWKFVAIIQTRSGCRLRHAIKSSRAFLVARFSVRHHIPQIHTSIVSDVVLWYGASIQQLIEELRRHSQNLRRPLCRDGLIVSHLESVLPQDLTKFVFRNSSSPRNQ